METGAAVTRDPVPGLVKRNTAWLAATQVFVGSGINFTASLGSLIVVSMLGSTSFAGLAVASTGVGRIVAGYPFGRFSDRFGRRPGLLLGLGIAFTSALVIGTSVQLRFFPGFLVGIVAMAVGMQGVQQLRLAAAEMYPPDRRAFVLGLLLTGSVGGVIVSPTAVAAAESIAAATGAEPLATPWFAMTALIVVGTFAVLRVHPDPRRIALDLARYYPSFRAAPASAVTAGPFGVREFLAEPRRRAAAIAMVSAQASMLMAMVTIPLQLSHHGQTLAAITLSNSIHVAGMFGLSMPVGWLVGRLGPRAVLIGGVLVEAAGAAIATASADYALVTIGAWLVGVGWSGANVSSSALVIAHTPAASRGRAIGTLDSLASTGVVFPLMVGLLVDAWGVSAAGLAAIALLAVPLPYVLRLHARAEAHARA